MRQPLPDCRTCGACCVEAGAIGVYYGTAECPSGPPETTPRHLTRSVRNRMGFASYEADAGTRCMKTEMGGRCCALQGEVGSSTSCRIYDRRPNVCRAFAPGSAGCLAARETMAWKLSRLNLRPHGYPAPETAAAIPATAAGGGMTKDDANA